MTAPYLLTEKVQAVDCNLLSSVSAAICVAVLVCVWNGLCDVCLVPVRAGAAFIFQSPKSRCHQDNGERQIVVATTRWQVEGVSAPLGPPDGSWGHYLLFSLSPYCLATHLSLWRCTVKSLQVSYCVIVIKCKHIIRSLTSLGSLCCLSSWWSKLIISVFPVDCHKYFLTKS